MSSSFRDRPSLSERLRGKSTEELIQEMRNSMDESKKKFFNKSRPSWFSSGPSSSSRRFPFDNECGRDIEERLDKLAEQHPEIAEPLRSWRQDSSAKKKRTDTEAEQEPPEQFKEREELSGDALRGLKAKLRNTVPDMRREQEDESDRVSRSQSAPPSQQHAVAPESQAQNNSQPREPVIRHIPIYVEGRDEPVINKDFVDSPFPREKRNMSRDSSPMPPPMRHTNQEQQHANTEPQTRPQHTSSVHINHNQDRQVPVDIEIKSNQQSAPHPAPVPPAAPGPQQAKVPKQPAPSKPPGPLEKVQAVQQEVGSLVERVEKYGGGTRQDKEYVYLDEMLTRNLLKLDDIETEGKEDVRAARKEAIRQIQRCISQLEGKAPLEGAAQAGSADPNVEGSKELNMETSQPTTTDPPAATPS